MVDKPSDKLIDAQAVAKWIMGAAGAIMLALVFWAGSSLQDHGQKLSVISTALTDLKEGQARIETSLTGRIGELVNVQEQEANEIAAIKQAQRDAAQRDADQIRRQ